MAIKKDTIELPGGGRLSCLDSQERPTRSVCGGNGQHPRRRVDGGGRVHNLPSRCLPDLLIAGTVHMYPTLNPGGLTANTRSLPGDGQDLNRMFPGKPRGSAAERHAHCIWKDLQARVPDALIDLHTDVAGAIPYAIVDRVVRVRIVGG